MNLEKMQQLADKLIEAGDTRTPIEGLRAFEPEISIADAYRIQLLTIEKRLMRGATVSGKKIGLTSKAMQDLLGVNQPDYGHLLNTMLAENAISMSTLIQPKVEAEVAFVLKKDLRGPGVTTTDVLAATDYIMASLEIVDSRIADWKISIAETVADNASSGMYLTGEKKVPVSGLDMRHLGMVLYKNGQIMNMGAGTAALGHPAFSVAWLANALSAFGAALHKGEVILSGALSAALPAAEGDVFSARFSRLGDVSVRFTK